MTFRGNEETVMVNHDVTKNKDSMALWNQMSDGWEKSCQNEVIHRLDSGDNLQDIMESFPEIEKYFTELDTIDCSDGRVLAGKKIGVAGSLVLLSDSEKADFVAHYKGKIKALTTHADCGAAAIAWKMLKPEEIPEGVSTADEYGTYRGKKLAEELGATHIFLNREEMANEYHNETALVLDVTGQFDSTNLEGFPAHFVCSGAGLGFSENYMESEIKTLVGIAMGHHGFGADRFSADNPFYVIVAAENQEDLERWQWVAKQALAEFGDKAATRGFIRPEAKK